MSDYYQEINLALGNTTVEIRYFIPVLQSSDQLTLIKLRTPTPGIWNINIYGDIINTGIIHAWLPITGFIREDTSFLTPDPNFTVTSPGTARVALTTGGYDDKTGSLYASSGRGPTRLYQLKPYITSPAVNVFGINNMGYTTLTGTSVAAAITTGAAALLLEWGIVRGNNTKMNTVSVLMYLSRGANKRNDEIYPNNSWGFGTLDLYRAFQLII